MSVAPPAGNGTTMRTGFDGYVCASADAAYALKASAASTLAVRRRRIMVSSRVCNDCGGMFAYWPAIIGYNRSTRRAIQKEVFDNAFCLCCPVYCAVHV